MFMVINKSKIISYIVVFSSVLVLFFTASTMQTKKENVKIEQTIQTSNSPKKEIPIYSVDTDKKNVALTINCAWSADDIDKILEVLNKSNIKITFFVVGDWAEKNPEALSKITAMGHEIGNHSFSHPHVNKLSKKENEKEILKCSKLIKALTGQETKLYRAPYGEYNDTVIKTAKDLGYIPIQWSVDTLDYEGIDGEQMWNRLNNKITNGSIILMHNGTEHTADSLEMIINNIKNKGYSIVPVSELLIEGNYIVDSNGIQKKK